MHINTFQKAVNLANRRKIKIHPEKEAQNREMMGRATKVEKDIQVNGETVVAEVKVLPPFDPRVIVANSDSDNLAEVFALDTAGRKRK